MDSTGFKSGVSHFTYYYLLFLFAADKINFKEK